MLISYFRALFIALNVGQAYPSINDETVLITKSLFPSRDEATALARRSVGNLVDESEAEEEVNEPLVESKEENGEVN